MTRTTCDLCSNIMQFTTEQIERMRGTFASAGLLEEFEAAIANNSLGSFIQSVAARASDLQPFSLVEVETNRNHLNNPEKQS